VLSVANNVGFAQEGAALAAALRAASDTAFRSAVVQWLALRRQRRSVLPPEAIEYENGAEFSEGLAKYTEYRLLETLEGHGIVVRPAAVAEGISGVQWPGRLDLRRLPGGREVLLDAAHNPDGAAALAAFLRAASSEKPPLVFAAIRDKAIDKMLNELAKTVAAIVFTCASHPRSADTDELAARGRAIAPGVRIEVERSPALALAAAWRIAPRIVVAGSIFLIGDVMKEISRS